MPSSSQPADRTVVTGRRWWPLAVVLLAAVPVAAELAVAVPARYWLAEAADWLRGAGWPGVLAYAGIYAAGTIVMLPGSVLTIAAGFVYGPWVGTLLVSPVSMAAASVAFLLGRTLLRSAVTTFVAHRPRLLSLDAVVGEHAWQLVLLLRLAPVVPFGLLNYALGLTVVRFRDYVSASFVGMLPATFLYVYAGSLVRDATALTTATPAGPFKQAAAALGAVGVLGLATLVTRLARRALAHRLPVDTAGGIHQ